MNISKLSNLLRDLNEGYKEVKKMVVVDGERKMTTEREYTGRELEDGEKRDKEGNIVRMDAEERRNRSDAATDSSKSSETKLQKSRSMEKRTNSIVD